MYLCDIIHNVLILAPLAVVVVNCLQNVSLRYYSQCAKSYNAQKVVVNCLQNVSLRYYSQYFETFNDFATSCELLTKCIFAILFTI